MLKLVLIKEGQRADIYSEVKRKKSIYDKFLEGLEEKDQKKIKALIEFILDKGIIKNKQKYKLVKPDIVELIIPNYRLLAYRKNDYEHEKYFYYILNGFKKPKKKTQDRLIDAAYKQGLIIKEGSATIIKNTKEGI